jgi:hypothetical protein
MNGRQNERETALFDSISFDNDEYDDNTGRASESGTEDNGERVAFEFKTVELIGACLNALTNESAVEQVKKLFEETRKMFYMGYVIPNFVKVRRADDKAKDTVRITGGNPEVMDATRRYLISKGVDVFWSPNGSGLERFRTISGHVRELWSSSEDTDSLEVAFSEALKAKANNLRITKFSVNCTNAEEGPRVYITINDRRLIPTLIKDKVRIKDLNITLYPPKIIMPQHPYQLAAYT